MTTLREHHARLMEEDKDLKLWFDFDDPDNDDLKIISDSETRFEVLSDNFSCLAIRPWGWTWHMNDKVYGSGDFEE